MISKINFFFRQKNFLILRNLLYLQSTSLNCHPDSIRKVSDKSLKLLIDEIFIMTFQNFQIPSLKDIVDMTWCSVWFNQIQPIRMSKSKFRIKLFCGTRINNSKWVIFILIYSLQNGWHWNMLFTIRTRFKWWYFHGHFRLDGFFQK